MTRIFAYARVSTLEQETENQVREIAAAGFQVEPQRIVTETISGSVAIARRKEFSRLFDKMEKGDVLIVTKLDRLGRNAIDVSLTVAKLENLGIRVHCLALGGVDLTSPSGKLTMGIINSVAQFERDLLIERTNAGIARARAQGKKMGRPHRLSRSQKELVVSMLGKGRSLSAVARSMGVSRATITRAKKEKNDV